MGLEIYDSSYKVHRSFSRIKKKYTRDGEMYYDGVIVSPLGYVIASSEPTRSRTYLECYFNGRIYMRTIRKSYSPRGLSIIAGKFIKELAHALGDRKEGEEV